MSECVGDDGVATTVQTAVVDRPQELEDCVDGPVMLFELRLDCCCLLIVLLLELCQDGRDDLLRALKSSKFLSQSRQFGFGDSREVLACSLSVFASSSRLVSSTDGQSLVLIITFWLPISFAIIALSLRTWCRCLGFDNEPQQVGSTASKVFVVVFTRCLPLVLAGLESFS